MVALMIKWAPAFLVVVALALIVLALLGGLGVL
jgi:hypothetical protein